MRSWLKAQGLRSIHSERVLFPERAALDGKNFFNDEVCELVNQRYKNAFLRGRSGRPRPLANDALRSQHIPFNLFGLLGRYLGSVELAKFLSALAGMELTAVEGLEIECTNPAAEPMLSDNTAFDACLTARRGFQKIVVGVEVKYTEGPYGWGKTEKRRMFDASDAYVRISETAEEIKPGAFAHLRNRHLKQIWRNFLLGVCTAESPTCNFVYIHLFPAGNVYQAAACERFASFLTETGRSVFKPRTYERFLDLAQEYLPGELGLWREYIRRRYIVSAE